MPENYAIIARDLHKVYTNQVAIAGVTLEVRAGEIFGLVGPDGAGKTTTMRILAGILDPTSGSAEVAGFDIAKQPELVKSSIGYMPQRFAMYGDLTVTENMRFFAGIYKVTGDEFLIREKRLLEFSRLEPFRDRLASNLSGGMKQKLALACTLIHTPQVLFLDEPTTGVDPVSRRDFWRILYSLLKDGVTVFVSTPYMDEAERCNRVALISQGKITICDTPHALKGQMRGDLLEVLAHPIRVAHTALHDSPNVLGVQIFGDRLHVWVQNATIGEQSMRAELAATRVTITTIRQIVPSLEDVFISLANNGVEHGE